MKQAYGHAHAVSCLKAITSPSLSAALVTCQKVNLSIARGWKCAFVCDRTGCTHLRRAGKKRELRYAAYTFAARTASPTLPYSTYSHIATYHLPHTTQPHTLLQDLKSLTTQTNMYTHNTEHTPGWSAYIRPIKVKHPPPTKSLSRPCSRRRSGLIVIWHRSTPVWQGTVGSWWASGQLQQGCGQGGWRWVWFVGKSGLWRCDGAGNALGYCDAFGEI